MFSNLQGPMDSIRVSFKSSGQHVVKNYLINVADDIRYFSFILELDKHCTYSERRFSDIYERLEAYSVVYRDLQSRG